MIIVSIALAIIWLSIDIEPIYGLPQTTGQEGTFFVGEKHYKQHQLAGSPIKLAGDTIMVGLTYLHGVYSNKTRKPPTDESDEMITARPEKLRSGRRIFEKRSINGRKRNQIKKSYQAEHSIEKIDGFDGSAADDTAIIRDGIAEYSVFEDDIKEHRKTAFRELNEDFLETRRIRSILDTEKNK